MHAPEVVRGRVIAHRDGYGFLARDDGGEDLFLPARQMRGLMHGDLVACEVRTSRRGGRPTLGRSGGRGRGDRAQPPCRGRPLLPGRGAFLRIPRPPEHSPRRGGPRTGRAPTGRWWWSSSPIRPPESDGATDHRPAVSSSAWATPNGPAWRRRSRSGPTGSPHVWPEDALAEAERVPLEVADARPRPDGPPRPSSGDDRRGGREGLRRRGPLRAGPGRLETHRGHRRRGPLRGAGVRPRPGGGRARHVRLLPGAGGADAAGAALERDLLAQPGGRPAVSRLRECTSTGGGGSRGPSSATRSCARGRASPTWRWRRRYSPGTLARAVGSAGSCPISRRSGRSTRCCGGRGSGGGAIDLEIGEPRIVLRR